MLPDLDTIAAYDFELPDRLIADRPLPKRDDSRLLIVHREARTIEHRQFRDLPDYLSGGDVAVFNTTRVLPARLRGVRLATGGRWEGLFVRGEPDGTWRIMGRTRGRPNPGETLRLHAFSSDATLDLTLEAKDAGEWTARPQRPGSVSELLEQVGAMPLPPYVGRNEPDAEDAERYQTVFAETPGAIAAPTAGLHFTPAILQRLSDRGVHRADVTLHVGIGTFRPVSADRLDNHLMHSEVARITDEAVNRINAARTAGGRTLAVGTTAVRTLETAAADGVLRPFDGKTDLFLRPGCRFHATDRLLTNFHLPKSTLLVLVSALAGYELVRQAYAEAVAEEYRFFSYGDAMLITE